MLVNLGPLLWHFENNAPGTHGYDGAEGDGETTGIADPGSFKLTDDEVMSLVERTGSRSSRVQPVSQLRTSTMPDSMLQNLYKASFWVARKPRI